MNIFQKLRYVLKTENNPDDLKQVISVFLDQQQTTVTRLDKMNEEMDVLLEDVCRFLDKNTASSPKQKNELRNKIVEFRMKKSQKPTPFNVF